VDPATKKELSTLRKNPQAYALRIVELKHAQVRYGSQRDQCARMLQRMVAGTSVTRRVRVKMLDEPSFVSNMMRKRGMTADEAKARWDQDSTNPDMNPETVGGIKYLPVTMDMEMVYDRSVAQERCIEHAPVELRNPDDMRQALRHTSNVLRANLSASSFQQLEGSRFLTGHEGMHTVNVDRDMDLQIRQQMALEEGRPALAPHEPGVQREDSARARVQH